MAQRSSLSNVLSQSQQALLGVTCFRLQPPNPNPQILGRRGAHDQAHKRIRPRSVRFAIVPQEVRHDQRVPDGVSDYLIVARRLGFGYRPLHRGPRLVRVAFPPQAVGYTGLAERLDRIRVQITN